jgi:DNA-binding transcriptional ArsR family regulator
MTPATRILRILDALGEAYGLDIVQGSAGKLRRSSIYVHLTRLQDAGLVLSRYALPDEWIEGEPRRRLYRLMGTAPLRPRMRVAVRYPLDNYTDKV